MRITVVVTIALSATSFALTGCGALPGDDKTTDDAMNRCVKYYFRPGTPAMARCVEREARSGVTGRGNSREADRAYVKCIGFGFQPGSDRTARCVQREVNDPGTATPQDTDE